METRPGIAGSPAPPAASHREHWFPVAFVVDLGDDEPHRISIVGEHYVLFRGAGGEYGCLVDRCPHRAARLSDGRLRDGTLECLYHGWRMGTDGKCKHIPQLGEGRSIPDRACVPSLKVELRQGIVWVWGGDRSTADAARIPILDQLERFDCQTIDFAIDLPYDQDYLIENVLDYAHIHIAHDGSRGGGRRELAGPLKFRVSEVVREGFSASIQSVGKDAVAGDSRLRGAEVEFVAPNLVHYVSHFHDEAICSGLALYSTRLAAGSCRLLYRAYSNSWPLRERVRPRWLEHGFQCDLLEQDMAVVRGQAEEIRLAQDPPSKLWLPIEQSDGLVLKFRRWIDAFATDRPDHVGFTSRGPRSGDEVARLPADRFVLHTRQCSSCSRALRWFRHGARVLSIAAFLALAAACVTGGPARFVLASLAVLFQAGSMGSSRMARRFVATGGPSFSGTPGR